MENMVMGLTTTVIGLTIVLAVLGILAIILNLIKYAAPSQDGNAQQKPPITAVEPKKKAAPEPMNPAVNEELAAAITAAVAAYLSTPPSGFVVRSIRRTERWNAAVRAAHTQNR